MRIRFLDLLYSPLRSVFYGYGDQVCDSQCETGVSQVQAGLAIDRNRRGFFSRGQFCSDRPLRFFQCFNVHITQVLV